MGSNTLIHVHNYISNGEFLLLNILIYIGSSIKILADWKPTFIAMNAKTSKFTPLC